MLADHFYANKYKFIDYDEDLGKYTFSWVKLWCKVIGLSIVHWSPHDLQCSCENHTLQMSHC